jgi:hypothetical protein
MHDPASGLACCAEKDSELQSSDAADIGAVMLTLLLRRVTRGRVRQI